MITIKDFTKQEKEKFLKELGYEVGEMPYMTCLPVEPFSEMELIGYKAKKYGNIYEVDKVFSEEIINKMKKQLL